ncbi:hypothetical protein ACHAPE_003957 [Trichoderma viride]
MSGAELLGVAAAAAQFAEVAFKTAKFIKVVVDEIQDAPDRLRQEAGRIESFASLAAQIKTTKSLQTEDVGTILNRCESCIQELQTLLQKISFKHDDTWRKKTWKAVCGLQEAEDIIKLFTVLHQEYSTLDTHINLRTNAVAEAVLAKLTDLDTQGQPADLSKRCLQDLFITDPAIDRAKLITSKGEIVSGTCDWITKREEFVNWITSDSGLLWISGGPGLGKTMLSIYLTEYLSSYFKPLENGKSHFSTYFFCDAKDNTRNTSVAIVRGLLFQLLQQKGELFKHILPTYEVQNEQIFQQSSFETIWKIFLRMTNDIEDSQVSCVLDGLDECEPESLQDLLNKLNKIASTSPRLKVIVLSRGYPSYLGASLGQFLRIRLDPDAKTEVSDGLDLYISARVAELSKSKQYPDELTDHVKRTLRHKSGGIYLWVSFVVKDLEKIQVFEVEESLDQLPEGLYPFYERILEQVDPAHRGLTLDVLRWCAFAIKPLTLRELASALGIQPTGLLDGEAVLRGKLTYCGHFLSISDLFISLVHQSAYEFLTRQISNGGNVPWFSLSNMEMEHSRLASACIVYFHDVYSYDEDLLAYSRRIYGDPDHPNTSLRYAWFGYATHQWHKHFDYSNQYGVQILEQYPLFFAESSVWNNWANWTFRGRNGDVMFVAAKLGLTVLMRRILEDKGHRLYWNLHAASENGHLAIVKLLVENGVHVDCEDKDNFSHTPLSIALGRGHRQVVEFLLTCGANINGTDQASSPLLDAVGHKNYEVVKLLLEWKPHDCPKPRYKWSSPRKLTAPKHALNVNCRDDYGDTPLHSAARKGSIEVIRLLLVHPSVDTNMMSKWNFSPMHLALIYRRWDVIQCLVRSGNVPLPEPDEDWGCGAGHFAAVTGKGEPHILSDYRLEIADNLEILPLICEQLGADPQLRTAKVSCPDDEWHTHHFDDFELLHDLLLFLRLRFSYHDPQARQSGLINQHGSCHETALSLSAKVGNETAIAYLVDCCNIDPNESCRGCDGATPLHVAAQSLQLNVVGMLISRWKVDVNCMDRYRRTPLHLVVSAMLSPFRYNMYEGEMIIKELVAAGAQRSARDVNGGTPQGLFEARDRDQVTGKTFEGMELTELLMYE